jgi:Got1/Sft2-like family
MASEMREVAGHSMSSVKSKFHKLRDDEDGTSVVEGGGTGESEEPTWHDGLPENITCFPSMTFKQRLWGFLICVLLGIGLSFLSVAFLKSPPKFGIIYTLGNIVALTATCFLIGPIRQLKIMFKPVRLVAAIIFIVFMALTLWAGFTDRRGSAIIFMCCQSLALIWYSLSFIPYARTIIIKFFTGPCRGKSSGSSSSAA